LGTHRRRRRGNERRGADDQTIFQDTVMKKLLLFLLLFAAPAQAQNYYLGPWVWVVTTADPENGDVVNDARWEPPANTVASIDLRTPAQAGTPGPTAQGFGLFAVNGTLGTGYFLLGSGADISQVSINNQRRNGWESRLGYRPAGATLAAVLWDMLTNGADATGASRVKPLMPGHDRRLRLFFGGFTRDEAFALDWHPHAEKVIAVERENFRQLHEDALAGLLPSDAPMRYVDVLTEKYGVAKNDRAAWEQFIPEELRGPGLVAHATTITEDWNCTDSTNLDCDLDWTETTGDAEIIGNVAEGNNSGAHVYARAESDLSGTDHYAQVQIIGGGGTQTTRGAGAAARFAGAANTFYWAQQVGGASGNGTFRLFKVVSGTPTALGTGSSQTQLAVKKVEANGSTIKIYSGGTERESVSDTAITTGTRTGVAWINPNGIWDVDNFEAADLAAPADDTVLQTIMIQ